MATATTSAKPAARKKKTLRIGPRDHGRRMTLEAFINAETQDGWLYELARGVLEVTQVPRPRHGRVVDRVARLFIFYDEEHPGRIQYRAGGGECRIRLPGMVSDRHPDQAIYLDPEPPGPNVWAHWIPSIVVEIVSPGGRKRDFVAKREEYLRMGVKEYWILDPEKRRMHVLIRQGDTWDEKIVAANSVHRTRLLPGLTVRPSKLFDVPAS